VKREPLGTARGADRRTLRTARSVPFEQVAEEVAARADMPEPYKVRILLAFVRALSKPQALAIRGIDDVDRLAVTNPEACERLLRSYWILLGARRRAA
jgi:hypothetical protein